MKKKLALPLLSLAVALSFAACTGEGNLSSEPQSSATPAPISSQTPGNTVNSTVSGITSGVGSVASGIASNIGGTVSGAVSGIGSTVSGIVSDLGSTASNIASSR